jgi:Ras-related protein Rab-1A
MFKAVLIGDSAVGKTSVRRRYLGKGFISSHIATIGVDFAQKLVKVDEQPVLMVIWDLAGQEGYKSLRRRYYEGASALILIYDITNKDSFENASAWVNESFKHIDGRPTTLVLGNKTDLRTSENKEKFVTTEEGAEFAISLGKQLNISTLFYETSAKNGENIQEAFTELARFMIAELKAEEAEREGKLRVRKVM